MMQTNEFPSLDSLFFSHRPLDQLDNKGREITSVAKENFSGQRKVSDTIPAIWMVSRWEKNLDFVTKSETNKSKMLVVLVNINRHETKRLQLAQVSRADIPLSGCSKFVMFTLLLPPLLSHDHLLSLFLSFSDFCRLPADPGPCRGNFQRYFYNRETGQCESFSYGGCLGNRNHFTSERVCVWTCERHGEWREVIVTMETRHLLSVQQRSGVIYNKEHFFQRAVVSPLP